MSTNRKVDDLAGLANSFKKNGLTVLPLQTFIETFLPDRYKTPIPAFKLKKEKGDGSQEEFCDRVSSGRPTRTTNLPNSVPSLSTLALIDQRRLRQLFAAQPDAKALPTWTHADIPIMTSRFDEDIYLRGTGDADAFVLGQLAAAVANLMNTQHRTFVMMIHIFGNRARVIRWDRGGVVASEVFDYDKREKMLTEILYATEKEAEVLLQAKADAAMQEPVLEKLESVDKRGVFYKINVDVDIRGEVYSTRRQMRNHTFVFRNAFYDDNETFLGRSTRVFYA
ncbi:hypothetical protein EIP91_009133, partial [Steccherinum ochraceum]